MSLTNKTYCTKEDKTKYKRGVEERNGKPHKKESNRNPGNKKSLYSDKKTQWKATATD
jgi:hypothetical protein